MGYGLMCNETNILSVITLNLVKYNLSTLVLTNKVCLRQQCLNSNYFGSVLKHIKGPKKKI